MKRLLFTLAFLLLADSVWAATLYFSSSGSGTACTTGTPCAFSRINTLAAGDIGIIKNGTHSVSTPITANCSAGASSGTSGNPITLRAETERQAWLQPSGTSGAVIDIRNCAWWVINGFRISGVRDGNTIPGGGLISVASSSNINITRNLLHDINVYGPTIGVDQFNTHGIGIVESNGGLIEENECYRTSRHCIFLGTNGGNSSNNFEVRRNYCNPTVPYSVAQGNCISVYTGSHNLIENNIAENGYGIEENNSGPVVGDNKYLGNIFMGMSATNPTIGARIALDCRDASLGGQNRTDNEVLTNNVQIGGTTFLFGGGRHTVSNNSNWSSTREGFAQVDNCPAFSGTATVTGINNLAVNYGITGFANYAGTFTYNKPSAQSTVGGTTPYSPAASDPRYTSPQTITPNATQLLCPVYILDPQLKGQGVGGADIGANVLYQYNNGALDTTKPLWDFSIPSGANRGQWIARGAVITGVNDTNSLADVHTRLGFGNGACPTPAGVVGVASVSWTSNRGGAVDSLGRTGPNSGSASLVGSNWTINNIPLSAGINNLVVTYTDTASVQTTDNLVVTYAPTFPGNTLAGAWSFDNVATDSSGNGNNATLVNGATYGAGRFGASALALDGVNDYAQVADANSLDSTQSFTFSAWVFPTAIPTTNWSAVIVKNYMIALYATSTYCGAGTPLIYFNTNGISGPGYYACSPQVLPINQWTYLAGTYDGSNLRLYTDGVLRVTTAASGYIEPSALSLQIGASTQSGVTMEYFAGRIDEARVYNWGIPLTAGSNTTPGASCTQQNYADNASNPSIIGNMNCGIIAVTTPVTIKFPASATSLKVGAAPGAVKFGQAGQ